MKVQAITQREWEKLLRFTPHSAPFHSYTWGKFISSQFKATFAPLLAREGGRQWLVPGYLKLPWADKNAIHIGSIGYGGPLPIHLIDDPLTELQDMQRALLAVCQFVGVKKVRAVLYPSPAWGNSIVPKEMTASSTCKVYLAKNPEATFQYVVSGNARTAVRKAEKSGITVRDLNADSGEELAHALALLHNTQESVGSPYRTDAALFTNISRLRTPSVIGKAFVAECQGNIVGVVVAIHNQRELFHLFHGWQREFASTCPNQALIWHMIKYAHQQNLAVFNMGESHSPALLQAKLRWGGVQENVPRITLSV